MPATRTGKRPPTQKRKAVPSRTPGMARVRDSASRSRLQSPSRKRNEADARKASDRSRLQAPKSAASKARSRAAMKKRLSSQFKKMGGTIDSSAGSSYQMRPMSPMASTRDRITKALKQRERQSRSRLRQS